MSLHSDAIARHAMPVLFTQMGRTVIYRAENKDDVTLTALVGDARDDPLTELEGRGSVQIARMDIITTRDSTGIYGGLDNLPRNGDFVVDGLVWTIDRVDSQTDGMLRFSCIRYPGVMKARRGFRSPV